MATQPKKTNTQSSSKKTPGKKRRRKKSRKSSNFKKSLFIVLGVFLMISMVAFGYFLGQNDMLNGQTPIAQTYKTYKPESKKKLLEDLSKIQTEKLQEKKESVKKKVPRVEKQTSTKPLPQEEAEEEKIVKKEEVAKVTIAKHIALADKMQKPKLAIIIDDVSTRRQLNSIQATGIKMTPSIFPPSERSMTSHTLATGLEHYMIHLPMESGSAQFNKQYKTLITTFSKVQIEARAKELRVLFPTARYINNHTGSVFTDDYNAMQTLYTALRKEGFVFLDSRTIGSTKVPKITEDFGDAYVARDVFIDNEHNVPYIHRQLQKAVKVAKKRGYAIAIGHPHKMTMKALSSAGSIFNDVELVYIDELYQ
ncbi:MAG: divergent polysaccharide deacetylase family protein [Sulfurovum sp.]|uniref:divergent polysaccharide deacetylase family protein n=1 Tax=Sulfurovum sp. TaxID=1969726 RepID=UPI002867ECC4|nr:divergent polysaccharide deacetylase family protein [Sulfurovum sp.]MCO4845184.1 divergent polysaccharide deacetylase family protein [Sulfurovum sp.]